MRIAGRILRGVWVDERNIADARELAAMLGRRPAGAAPRPSMSQAVHQRYEDDSRRAIAAGVFARPATWSRAIFWGQDRLDFLQRRLAKG